jgi:arsenic resistance protein ArsH
LIFPNQLPLPCLEKGVLELASGIAHVQMKYHLDAGMTDAVPSIEHPEIVAMTPVNDVPTAIIDETCFEPINASKLCSPTRATHSPRILLLYGSVRQRSFSRLASEEAARILQRFGAETRMFNPSGLPLPDDAETSHPKVQELRELVAWSEGMVWCSPERHGAMTGIMKAQIDWIPLSIGAVRPTQGKTLAVMQVSGGSQSFNAVNQLRLLGRWMRLITIPNQSSVPKAFMEFDDQDRMKPSALYDRIVDVMEELVKFTLLTRDCADYLVERYSERREDAQALSKRVNQRAIEA